MVPAMRSWNAAGLAGLPPLPRACTMALSIGLGQTAFTRMPAGASSSAAVRVRPTTACLLAVVGHQVARPAQPGDGCRVHDDARAAGPEQRGHRLDAEPDALHVDRARRAPGPRAPGARPPPRSTAVARPDAAGGTLPSNRRGRRIGHQIAATAMLSTRYLREASRASTVAR